MKTLGRVTLSALALSMVWPATGYGQMEPIRTRRTEFRIPFTFSKDDYARIGAQEVQLFLSLDRGNTWQHVQSELPTAQKFRYRATNEGEHWFAVRTLDREGQLRPLGKLSPGLVVLVDTQKPALRVDVFEVPGEGAGIEWQIIDSDLEATSLRIEYKVPGSDKWRSASFAPAAQGTASVPILGAETVAFRVGVRDRAGNVAVTERSLKLATPAISIQPGVPKQPETMPSTTPAVVETGSLAAPAVQRVAQNTTPAMTVTHQASTPVKPEPPAEPVVPATKPAQSPQPELVSAAVLPQVSAAAAQKRVDKDKAAEQAEDVEPDAELKPYAPIQTTISAAKKKEIEPTEPVDPTKPRIVTRKEFQLAYAVDGQGSSGIKTVEVFITEDGGRKWWRYGEDADRRSPIEIKVPREGTYGFAIAARSGVGLGELPPRHGDKPHVTVVVDQTAPKCSFGKIEMLAETKELSVEWSITDQHAHGESARLEYAVSPNGPWVAMGAWQSGSSLKWAVPADAPARVHLRLTGRDAAGNTAAVVYPESVVVDTARPRVRITNVKYAVPSGK